MALTVRERIEEQETGIVGREAERAVLRLALEEDGPLVIFIHGIGGVGKSALLDAFIAEARGNRAIVLSLEGGAIEPTARGFLAALSSATGRVVTTTDEAVFRLSDLGDRGTWSWRR